MCYIIYKMSITTIKNLILKIIKLMIFHNYKKEGEFYNSDFNNTFEMYKIFEKIQYDISVTDILKIIFNILNLIKNIQNINVLDKNIIDNYFNTIDEISFFNIKIKNYYDLEIIYNIIILFPNIKKLELEQTDVILISLPMFIFLNKIKNIKTLESINFSNNNYNIIIYEGINNYNLKINILNLLFRIFKKVELSALQLNDDNLTEIMSVMVNLGVYCKTIELDLSFNEFIEFGDIFTYLKNTPLKSLNISNSKINTYNIYILYLKLIDYLKESNKDFKCNYINLSILNNDNEDENENDDEAEQEEENIDNIFDENKINTIISKITDEVKENNLSLLEIKLPITKPIPSTEINKIFQAIGEKNLNLYWEPQYINLFSYEFYKILITFLILNFNQNYMFKLPLNICYYIFSFFNRKLEI